MELMNIRLFEMKQKELWQNNANQPVITNTKVWSPGQFITNYEIISLFTLDFSEDYDEDNPKKGAILISGAVRWCKDYVEDIVLKAAAIGEAATEALGQRYFYTDSASKDSETIVRDAHPDLEKRDRYKLCRIVEFTLKFMLWQFLGLNGPRFETIQWKRIGELLNNGKEVVMYPALTSHLKGPSPKVHVEECVMELE